MKQAVDYMRAHLGEELNLEVLCGVFYMSKTDFVRKFIRDVGTPPIKYLREMRITEACRLLREYTWLSVLDISVSVGYHGTGNFNEAFRKQVGMTPSAYRSARFVVIEARRE